MIAIEFIAMLIIDRMSFLPRPWLPPTFVGLALATMVVEGLQ